MTGSQGYTTGNAVIRLRDINATYASRKRTLIAAKRYRYAATADTFHLPLVMFSSQSRIRTIGIDCRFAKTDSGLGRYTRELVRQLRRREDPWQYVFLEDEAIPYYSFQEQLLLPRFIRQSNVDVFHSPHFNVPFRCPVPFITTIHDLILHKYPNEASLPKRLAYRTLMKHAVTHAAHIIAVSQHTADGIVQTYGDGVRGKISVIHEGVSEQFQPQPEQEQQRVRGKYGLPDDFVLSVGACKEHKNVQTLIDACPAERTLVLVTGGKETAQLRISPNVRILFNVNDGDLLALYSAARCFVSASLAEGFNFPVLEALACGCPVIATERGSTPEVVGTFATLVEPTTEALRKALGQFPPRPTEAAIAHARSFSWAKTAQETANVYRALLSANG